MNTGNHFCSKFMLGVLLLAFSQQAWSLGLGEVKVESFLGQPLEVKIELITRPSDDLASVSVGLASAADYKLIGASRDDVSVPLQFAIKGPDGGGKGSAYIAVSSRLAIGNPVVRLILEVNWSSGRMLREYTLFLDPPTFSQPAPAPSIEAGRTAEIQAAPAPRFEADRATEPQPAPAPRIQADRSTEMQPAPASRTEAEKTIEARPTPATENLSDAAISGADDYYPVQGGDTLWRIARDWSAGRRLNLNKVMLAIQRLNPEAFSRNNINRLRRGVILRMPHRDDVNSISSASANREVVRQIDAFRSNRGIHRASPTVPLISEESVAIEPAQSDATPGQPLTEDEPLASASPDLVPTELAPRQLELLPPSEDNSADSTSGFEESEAAADDDLAAQALREELSRKEEELINQQQQNAYLEQRLQELEGQLEESRKATVDDKNLASMEERLRQERLGDRQVEVPKVVSSPTREEPWYKRFSLWLLGLLVLGAVVASWLLSRRGSSDTTVSDPGGAPDSLREIKQEADDAPRALDSSKKKKVARIEVARDNAIAEAAAADPETAASSESEDTLTVPAGEDISGGDEDAELLDEESADPEIQLDLARAYVSMGDKEAARVILDEVIANGSDEQQAEANKMKELL